MATPSSAVSSLVRRGRINKGFWYYLKKDNALYILLLPGLLFYLCFRYLPMFGTLIAFQDFKIYKGVLGSPWVGLKHFIRFFSTDDFFILFKNTFLLGLYNALWSFPAPIIFAILLNEVRHVPFKKFTQTASYLPTFLSVVVVASMTYDLLSPTHGLINNVLAIFGFERIYFMVRPEWFRTVYIASGIWQSMGNSAIVFIAAITTVDASLYEAAVMDGCGRIKSIWHITLPGILPTVMVMLILRIGNMFKTGFEKVLLLYHPATYSTADVFSTFVYRKGILDTNYSYAAAVGLFEATIALIMILSANALSKRLTEQSII